LALLIGFKELPEVRFMLTVDFKNIVVKQDNLLLIFIKNPEPGNVKTRLAATIGNQKAYQVYLKLLRHTLDAAAGVDARRQVWYSSFVDSDDFISESEFTKKVQYGKNLGDRMLQSFKSGFDEGYKNIVIIGSDCPDVTPAIIEKAFEELRKYDVVIGPSLDGGYYLLGMKKMYGELFNGIEWSTERVMEQTLAKADNLSLSISRLPDLNDIDTIEDLKKAGWDDRTSN
jgi:rSAM/selenodomain-associated transferase 1